MSTRPPYGVTASDGPRFLRGEEVPGASPFPLRLTPALRGESILKDDVIPALQALLTSTDTLFASVPNNSPALRRAILVRECLGRSIGTYEESYEQDAHAVLSLLEETRDLHTVLFDLRYHNLFRENDSLRVERERIQGECFRTYIQLRSNLASLLAETQET